jgi:hypothetical protein
MRRSPLEEGERWLASVFYLRGPGRSLIVPLTIPLLCLALWAFVTHQERRNALTYD